MTGDPIMMTFNATASRFVPIQEQTRPQQSVTAGRSPMLEECTVLRFGSNLLASSIRGVPAHFFLAGGAFKSILTGCQPHDLDIWTSSQTERKRLICLMSNAGARQLPSTPFADRFEVRGGLVAEIVRNTAFQSLPELCGSFDLALSAVGVEFLPDGTCRAFIHPLALESIRRRAVLLLKPLRNTHYILATLERMRRYAHELGFQSPPEEEELVWRMFDDALNATSLTQKKLLNRLQRAGRGGFGVAEEARERMAKNASAYVSQTSPHPL